MKGGRVVGLCAALVAWVVVASAFCGSALQAQSGDAFSTSGQIAVNGVMMSYVVRHLPVSSFPALPAAVAAELNQRGCLIPQTFEAYGPENVIHGSFRQAGANDWAVLCSVRGTVSLLVFFESEAESPAVLASAAETARLQAHGATRTLGFDWGIDAASPEQVHEAQAGMRRRPPRLDHDAIADSIINGATIYHFYTGAAWKFVDTSD